MFNGSFCFSRSPVNTGSFDGSTEKSPTDERIAIVNVVIVLVVVPPLVIVVATPRGEKGFERSGKRFPGLSLFTFSCHFPDHHPTSVSHLSFYYPFLLSACSVARSIAAFIRRELSRSARGMSVRLPSKGKIAVQRKQRIGETKEGSSENPRTRGMLDERATICDRAARGKYLRGKQRARRID